MATKTFEELKQMAIQIRDEKTNKQNTATRIGTQMLEHLNKLEQDFLDKDTTEGKFSELYGSDTYMSNVVYNSYISELYIPVTGYDFIVKNISSNNRTQLDIYVGDKLVGNVWDATNSPVPGTVYEIVQKSDIPFKGYVVFSDIQGGNTGINEKINNRAYTLNSNPIIERYINSSIDKKIQSINDGLYGSDTYLSNIVYNSYISELYIPVTGYDFIVKNISSNNRTQLDIYVGDKLVGNVWDATNSPVPGTVYEIVQKSDMPFKGYVVFSDIQGGNTGINEKINNRAYTLNSNPIIERYINSLTNRQIKWTSNNSINSLIKELYIPNCPEGIYINRIWAKNSNNKQSLWIYNSDRTVFGKADRDIVDGYYDLDPIIAIYSENVENNCDIIGYVVLNGKNEYVASGETRLIDCNLVKNPLNSPRINKMINSTKQVIIIGDSVLSLPQLNNIFADILRGVLLCKVNNIACGGTTFADRPTPSYYDNFNGISWAESIANNNFDKQINAKRTSNEALYPVSVANAKEIDIAIQDTFVLCHLMGNDFNVDIPLGQLWVYDNYSYDKKTMLGAMSYVAKTIITAYPSWKLGFVPRIFLFRENNIPPYAQVSTSGESFEEWKNKFSENAYRMGFPVYGEKYEATRNAFNMSYSTTDKTHNTAYGFLWLAKAFVKYIKELMLVVE